MNPYHTLVHNYAELLHTARRAPFGGFAPLDRPKTDADSPRALIFSPHPDDECIIGALPLRIMREAHFNVINVAVTQGSNKERQAARWEELQRACDYIGYGLIQTKPNGLEKVNPKTRQYDRARKIYQTIGTYLGYALAHYADFYDLRHTLILGRVTSGPGGDIILNGAKAVLRAELPDLAAKIQFHIPNEKDKRHGQAVAAASLPVLGLR